MRRAAGNIQRTANDLQYATGNMHHAANNNGMRRNMQHAVRNMQHISNRVHRATRNMRQTSCSMQRTTTTCDATCNGQRAACKKPQTTLQRQRETENRQEGNIHRRPATCSRYRTENHTANNRQRATGNACNKQRTTYSRRHSRGREHMRDATGDTRHCRVSCAAGTGEPAACAKHFTRQPVRNTAQTPHTRGNIRPLVPQHAANTHENTRGETNEVRKLAHLGAASGSLRWTLGGGLTAR